MKQAKLNLLFVLLFVLACKKKEQQPEPQIITSSVTYTSQYLTKSGQGAAPNGIYWVISGDTMNLGQCTGTYSSTDYVKSFSFEVGKEYEFKIIRGIPPSMTSFELKNIGTIKFIDAKSSTDLYGGQSSVVFVQGATWTYNILYGQCGSITNQLAVMIP